jgi:2'-5' RNA ligase
MNERHAQLSLDGMAPEQPTDRLFFAIFPDPPAAARIASVAQSLRVEHGLRGRPQQADRLHVTLHHLGDHVGLRSDIARAAEAAAAQVAMPPFGIAFDNASSFSGRTRNLPLVLRAGSGVGSLEALHAAIGARMAAAGLAKWVKPAFVPHVTLLYDDRGLAPQAIEPIAWTVREFVLVHSLLGRTEHRVIGRWPLRG